MKRILSLPKWYVRILIAWGICLFGYPSAQAQLTVGNGGMVIKPGALLSVDGLALYPTEEVVLTGTALQRSTVPVEYAGSPSVNLVYTFGIPLSYTGTLRLPYTDDLLGGEPAENLRLIYAPAEGGPFVLIPETVVNETGRFAEYEFEAATTLQQISALAVDLAPPSVTAIEVSGAPSASVAAIQYTVYFNEAPANASVTDFALTATGTADGNIASISPVTANTITVTIDDITGTGTLRLDVVAESGITDANGNGNGTNSYVTAFTGGEVHTVDRNAPTAPSQPDLEAASDSGISSTDNITNDSTPTLIGTAEANSTIKITSDVDGVLGTTTSTATGDWSYTPVIPLTDGTHNLTATATDAANNESVASMALTIVIDTQLPTATIGSTHFNLKAGETATVAFTLSEPATNFTVADVAVSDGMLSDFSASSSTDYTATFEPSANTTVAATIDVAAGKFTDAAGNGNAAATQLTLAVDTEVPAGYTVSIDQATVTLANHTDLSFALNAAEVGTTFDYTLTSDGGGTPVTGSGWVSTANQQVIGIDVSGLANGTLTLSLTLTDASGNVGDPATDNVAKAVNYLPEIVTTGGSTTFTESVSGGPAPVAIDDALTVADPDNTTLASATVVITGNFQAVEDLLGFTNDGVSMGNISGSYDQATGVLTLTSAGAAATLAEWEAALRAVTYSNASGNPNTTTRTISFAISDGTDDSAPAAKPIAVMAVNSAPVITAPTSITANEDVAKAITGISFSDADAGAGLTTATFSITTGSLLATSGGGVTAGGTASALTLTGTIADLNAFIASSGVTYTPLPNAAGDITLTVTINDNGNTGTGGAQQDFRSVTLRITAVNDAPVVTLPATIAVDEDVPTALTGISFADVDAGSNPVTAAFSVASGTLTAVSDAGVTVTGTGTGELELTGSLADINTFIAVGKAKYTTALNATSNTVLTVNINDNGNTGTGGAQQDTKTITLVVTAINDAPVNTVPGAQSVDQNGILVFSTGNGSAISVSDVDAGGGSIRVTLTATNGLLTLSATTGLNFLEGSGTGDGTMTFDGSIADINAGLNGLVFAPTSGYNGAASLQIVSNDLGLTGSGGNQTDTDVIDIPVNPINPVVTAVGSVTSDGLYKIGDVISLTVTLDQTVTVDEAGGLPTLLLETGDMDREAAYTSGSGSNTLVFGYTVQAGDVSADLDYQSAAALTLNGATIRNISNQDVILTLPAVGGAGSIAGQHALVIDGIAPAVASVDVPDDGYHVEDDPLDFTVHFSENVTVDATGGTPYLEVTIGTTTVQAAYISGSGSSALAFRYVVQAGDADLDGIALGGSLMLNGGTIRDAAGNNAAPALNNPEPTGGVLVYAVNPSATLSTTAVSPQNGVFTATVVFSEAVTGFTLGDIDATNAALDNLYTADNTTYTLEVTPVADGDVSLSVPADAAINVAGNGNTASNMLTMAYDGTAPTAPVNLTVEAGDTEITLEWAANGETDIASYRVYSRVAGDPAVLLETVAAGITTYTHTGLTNGTEYHYQVSAVDAAGNESPLSAEVTATPMADQTITFDALADRTYGDAPFLLTATASSGLEVSYSSSDESVASVSGGEVTVHAVGTVTITASQAGNAAFYGAAPVTQQLTIAPAVLTVRADAGQGKVYGSDDSVLTYLASGFALTDDESILTGTLTRESGEDMGSYAITQGTLDAGNNYRIAYTGSNFAITPLAVTVRAEDRTKVFGQADPELTYTVAPALIAGDGFIGELTREPGEAVGTYGIMQGTLALSDNYTLTFVGAELAITPSAALEIMLMDGTFTYDGTEHRLAITGELPDGATVAYENNGRTDVGSQEVTARVSGSNYETLVLTATLAITPVERMLSFPAFSEKTYGAADFDGDVTASSGEAITYTSDNPSVAIITTDGLIRIVGAGQALITATVPANGNYSNRPQASRTLVVHKAQQSISFNAPAEVNRGAGSIQLDVSASSGLPVNLTIDDQQVATLDGTTLNIHRLGTINITATQEGDDNHEPAEPVTVTIRVVDPSADFAVRVHPAVSPNGDGINEFLMIEGIRDYPENRVTVFSRNGTVVWEAEGYDNNQTVFRGTGAGGLHMAPGTYFYIVEIRVNGRLDHRKGYFVLRY